MPDRGPDNAGSTPSRSNRWTLALAVLGTASATLGTLINWAGGSRGLFVDILLAGLCGCALVCLRRGRSLGYTPWIVGGVLLGASLVADLRVTAWPFAAALAFVFAGVIDRSHNRSRLTTRLLLVCASGIVNASILWGPLVFQHPPVVAAEFEAKELRMQTLLSDAPLHDVWAAHLRGGPSGLTMRDTRMLLIEGFRHNRITAFIALAAVRGVLGSLFGWDDRDCRDTATSYVDELSASDRDRSLTNPGDSLFVYTFEYEALLELRNCTVHAFIGMVLEPVRGGYTIYWAFYVKPVGWITPLYMALIRPFRHTVVYPSIVEGIEREWEQRWNY